MNKIEEPISFKQYCTMFHAKGYVDITEQDIYELWRVVCDVSINDDMPREQYNAILAASTGPHIGDDEMSYRIIVAKYWTDLKSWGHKSWGHKWSPAVVKILDTVKIVTDVKWVEPEPWTWGDYLAEL